MKRSTDRILTTHTGSLPRSPDLAEVIARRDKGRGTPADLERLPQAVRDEVRQLVSRQVEVGIDIVGDGEVSKIGYATYVRERLTGFGGVAEGGLTIGDLADVPDLAARSLAGLDPAIPACNSDVAYHGTAAVDADIANLKSAVGAADVEPFMTAATPGVIAIYLQNQHYPDDDAYLEAIAAAMRVEYEAIHRAGIVLQLDAPDLAMGRHVGTRVLGIEEFRRLVARRIEIINEATRGIAPDGMRLHLCWGNYQGPHHHDVALGDIIDLVLKARAQAIVLEAANPRHAHEWRVFEEIDLPDDRILIPGVIDTCTNYVEHPELVAERIVRFADTVGRERVIAGTDCGFASFASFLTVDPEVAWMKLRALGEGAAIASHRLWRR